MSCARTCSIFVFFSERFVCYFLTMLKVNVVMGKSFKSVSPTFTPVALIMNASFCRHKRKHPSFQLQ